MPLSAVRMIALDLDGTLLGQDGQVGPRNLAALQAAQAAGIVVVIATGRRHAYAFEVLRRLNLPPETLLVSSNGAVVRRFDSTLVERTLMPAAVASWLCGRLGEFRNALIVTFDKVAAPGEDERGALVVEQLEDLHGSIGRWMTANEPYIAHVRPVEDSFTSDAPIQMMLCGTVERMRRAEALLNSLDGIRPVGDMSASGSLSLSRTEYPGRDLTMIDIAPIGCSKGAALLRLAAAAGIPSGQIMAIGDNWNDLSMLEIAGYPVLMGNAPQDLRQEAARRGWPLTATHDADGVARAIEPVLAGLEAAQAESAASPADLIGTPG